MSEQFDLVKFIEELFGNRDLQAFFASDPKGALAEYGLHDVSAAEIKDALSVVGAGKGMGEAPEVAHHESAVSYVERIVTTNKYIDARETNIDKSIHQNIDTHGGKVVQNFDDHSVYAIGDGSVAAGGDIKDSTVVTGDNNQVGDHNIKGNGNVSGEGNKVINGDDNAAGFGQGQVNSTDIDGSLKLGEGAAFGSGGSTAVNNSDSSTNGSNNTHTKTELDNVGNKTTDNSLEDSQNSDTHTTSETHHSETGSHNTHESHETHESHSILDSLNVHL